MGLVRTNWKHGLAHVADTYATQRVGAIIGSNYDSMGVSAGWNMALINTHWAKFDCSIQFLNFEDAQTITECSARLYHFSYTMTASGNDFLAGVYIDYFTNASMITDAVCETPIAFHWRAIVVSI